jgi:dTDP-4-amino-4,6-dideoxygalactose transaminase
VSIPLLDLAAQYRAIQPEMDAAVLEVLRSAQFILGPNVAALEEEVARFLGAAYAAGVASGTDALILALRALEIGPGDEVIVPAYTFFATAEAVLLVGATPVFVDIEPQTYGLDPDRLEERISARTRAIIPVHLYGHPADIDAILALARRHGLHVIEDNAQAFGAAVHGQKTGSLGDVGCLSFFPSKNLGGYGDGGMILTRDETVDQRVRMLRSHGWRQKYAPEMVGTNSRLDELQAAILRVNLRHVVDWNARRRVLARRYDELLRRTGIGLPTEAPGCEHVYHLYVLRSPERDHLQKALSAAGIASAVYYPQPLHLLAPCRALGYRRGDFPVAELASAETLAIPLYPELTAEHQQRVVDVLVGELMLRPA